jgi:hypothetical protein
VGVCIGKADCATPLMEGVQVTVAWLQSATLDVSVPVPVFEPVVPTVSGLPTVPGIMVTAGPSGVVGGQVPEFPAKVWSTIVQDSVESPELSVLVTVTPTLKVLGVVAGAHVFDDVKPGAGVLQLKVALSKTLSPPVLSTIPLTATGEQVRVAVSGSFTIPLTLLAAKHSMPLVVVTSCSVLFVRTMGDTGVEMKFVLVSESEQVRMAFPVLSARNFAST